MVYKLKLISFLLILSVLFFHCSIENDEVKGIEESIPQPKTIEEAINSTVQYIENRGAHLDPLLVPIIDYAFHIEGIKKDLPYYEMYQKVSEDSFYLDQHILGFYFHYKKEFKLPTLKKMMQLAPMEKVLVQAFLCDEYPLDETFPTLIEQYAKSDSLGYGLTHVLLMYQWIKDKGCHLDVNNYINNNQHHLKNIINKTKRLSDVKVEAMAIACYIEKYEYLNDELINQLILQQSSDGAWRLKGGDSHGNDHITALALWTLIQYKNKDKERVKWIVEDFNK